MSWSLRAVTGGRAPRLGTAKPRRNGSKKSKKTMKPSRQNRMTIGNGNYGWLDQLSKQPRPRNPRSTPIIADDFVHTSSTRQRDISVKQIARTANDLYKGGKQAYEGGKTAYEGGKAAKGLIQAGIRKIKGNDRGYRLTYSESQGGQEFTETYRSYRHAMVAAEKMKAKGWQASIKPL